MKHDQHDKNIAKSLVVTKKTLTLIIDLPNKIATAWLVKVALGICG